MFLNVCIIFFLIQNLFLSIRIWIFCSINSAKRLDWWFFSWFIKIYGGMYTKMSLLKCLYANCDACFEKHPALDVQIAKLHEVLNGYSRHMCCLFETATLKTRRKPDKPRTIEGHGSWLLIDQMTSVIHIYGEDNEFTLKSDYINLCDRLDSTKNIYGDEHTCLESLILRYLLLCKKCYKWF